MAQREKKVEFRYLEIKAEFQFEVEKGIKKFLVYEKTSNTRAICIGFKTGSGHSSGALMSWVGTRIQVVAAKIVLVSIDQKL